MQKELRYSSSIKDMPLMFSEMKRTALLLCEDKSREEIIRLSVENNIFQYDKEKRRREVPVCMIRRLSTISKPLVEVIATGQTEDAKLITLLALIKSDRLLFEYMNEVFADTFYNGRDEVTDKDFLDFITRKAEYSEVVAKWTPVNLKNVRGQIKSILCEVGLAKRTKDSLIIQKPFIENKILSLIDDNDKNYAKAMLLEVY